MRQLDRTVLTRGVVGVGLAALLLGGQISSSSAAPVTKPDASRVVVANQGRNDLAFVENRGQVDPRVTFYLKTPGQTVWVTGNGIVFDLLRDTDPRSEPTARGKRELMKRSRAPKERLVFRQELIDADFAGRAEAGVVRPGVHNYFIGSDPARWRTGVRSYADIVYRDVWAGIDLKLYGNGRALEQEFVVRPGADPSRVRVAYRGIEGLAIAPDGSLRIRTAFGELHESVPRIYQDIAGKRVEVTGRYRLLSATSYAFEVGPYEKAYALVIDPTLTYSTYLGGSAGGGFERALSIAIDSSGFAYVTGHTNSTDFPSTIGPAKAAGDDVFVTKLTQNGSALVYSTFIGGDDHDEGTAIAVDSGGNAYVVGDTESTDYPSVNPFGTRGGLQDAFLTKLNSAGVIAYSSYLGGSGNDVAHGVAVDSTGAAYVTGETESPDFPTSPGAYQTVLNCGVSVPCVPSTFSDAFVTKITATAAIAYSTFLGGVNTDVAWAIAVDALGQAHVGGDTNSFNFAPGAGGLVGGFDTFAAKFSATGALMWATFFGGSLDDLANSIAVDGSGMVYLTGQTESPDFSTSPIVFGGAIDAFVTKLNPFNHTVGYFSFLGGTGDSGGETIAVDALGNAYVTGYNRGGFTQQGSQLPGTGTAVNDAFISSFGPAGNLEYSTLFGGTASDVGTGIAVDASGAVYVSGYTSSTDFPTAGTPYQGTFAGPGTDGFVAKVSPAATTTIASPTNPSTAGQNVGFVVNVTVAGSPATGGTLRLYDDLFFVRSQALVAGPNTINYAPLTAGNHTITVHYVNANQDDLVSIASLTQTVIGGGTTTTAVAAPLVLSPIIGSSGPQPIGDIRIAESAGASLLPTGRIQIALPPGMTFAGLPSVTSIVGYGLQIVSVGADAPRLEPGNNVFSFQVQTPSAGPAVLLVSGMSVIVPAGSALGPQSSSVNGPGVTAASVSNLIVVGASSTPSLSSVSNVTVGRGADDFTIVLTGINFGAGATVSFSRGGVPASDITVVSVTVDSTSKITIKVDVAPGATLGPLDVTVSNPGGGNVLLANAVSVTSAPAVTGTIPTPVFRTALKQSVRLTGTGFQTPTQSPANIGVTFSGTGITVLGVSYNSETELIVDLIVDLSAALTTRAVTIVNPDGGSSTSGSVVVLADPPAGAVVAEGPNNNTPPPPAAPPTITTLNPPSARRGTTISITGEGFSGLAAENKVTFTGAGGSQVTVSVTTVTVNSAAADTITVTVPSGAADGPVVVGVKGLVSNPLPFGITDPALSAVVPRTAAVLGGTAILDITGSKFTSTSTVEFALSAGAPPGAVNGITAGGITLSGDSIISIPITISSTAFAGPRDVTVRKPDGTFSTRTQAFQIYDPNQVAFEVKVVNAASQDITTTFLPSVDASVTLDASGRCIAKIVTPKSVRLRATYIGLAVPPPTEVLFELTAFTRYLGTSINDDCEIDPTTGQRTLVASRDVALGPVGGSAPDVYNPASLTAMAVGGGVYEVELWTYDWGAGAVVKVSRTDPIPGSATVTLPVDTDGDTLPDVFEEALTLANVNAQGAPVTELNVTAGGARLLDRINAAAGGGIKSAADGYTNFEKYRGIYLKGPANGSGGPLEHHIRLGAGQRHLFLRGHGFAGDHRLGAGQCGVEPPLANRNSLNFSEWTPVADTSGAPCPRFEVGSAFAAESIQVHDVTPAFSTSTAFPRRSFQTGVEATADLGELAYDAYNCNGGEPCDHTSKTGPRNWKFWTYGVSAVGSAQQYGNGARVLKKVVDSLFGDLPYEHRLNDPARVVADVAGNHLLAPLTIVADNSSKGSDNGVRDGTEPVDAQLRLLGDTYIPGSYGSDFSAFDVNKDRCTELPLITDPTTLTRCPDPDAPLGPPRQATRQQVVRLMVTHEIGHLVGASIYHSANPLSVNYQFTNNWDRDNFFGPETAPELRIHNRGQQ